MQTADERELTRSFCDSLPPVDSWMSDDEGDDGEKSPVNDSRPTTDSTADWYQRQDVIARQDVVSDSKFHRKRTPPCQRDCVTTAACSCHSIFHGSLYCFRFEDE